MRWSKKVKGLQIVRSQLRSDRDSSIGLEIDWIRWQA